MRALVISDTHGAVNYLKTVLQTHKDIKTIFFLGDGSDDFEELSYMLNGRELVAVSGNNDIACSFPYSVVKEFNGKKIYATHGHIDKVHMNLDGLKAEAKKINADIALYGHTHKRYEGNEDGLYIFNPGALTIESYGILDVEDDEIKMEFKRVY